MRRKNIVLVSPPRAGLRRRVRPRTRGARDLISIAGRRSNLPLRSRCGKFEVLNPPKSDDASGTRHSSNGRRYAFAQFRRSHSLPIVWTHGGQRSASGGFVGMTVALTFGGCHLGDLTPSGDERGGWTRPAGRDPDRIVSTKRTMTAASIR